MFLLYGIHALLSPAFKLRDIQQMEVKWLAQDHTNRVKAELEPTLGNYIIIQFDIFNYITEIIVSLKHISGKRYCFLGML